MKCIHAEPVREPDGAWFWFITFTDGVKKLKTILMPFTFYRTADALFKYLCTAYSGEFEMISIQPDFWQDQSTT